jgi:hypothetical protein
MAVDQNDTKASENDLDPMVIQATSAKTPVNARIEYL